MGEDSRNLKRWNILIYCVMGSLMSPNIKPNILSQICFSLLVFFIPMPVYTKLGIYGTVTTLIHKQVGILSAKTIHTKTGENEIALSNLGIWFLII